MFLNVNGGIPGHPHSAKACDGVTRKGVSKPYSQALMLCALFINNERVSLVQNVSISMEGGKGFVSLERVVLDRAGSILRKIRKDEVKNISICFFENSENEFKMNETPKLLEQYLLKNAHISEYRRDSHIDSDGRHWDSEIVNFTGESLEFTDEVNNEQQA